MRLDIKVREEQELLIVGVLFLSLPATRGISCNWEMLVNKDSINKEDSSSPVSVVRLVRPVNGEVLPNILNILNKKFILLKFL